MKIILVALSVLLSAFAAQAQVSYSGGLYTQNFDGLSPSGTSNTWTNNGTISGWYSDESTYTTQKSGLLDSRLTSYGTGTATDRALGTNIGTLGLLDPVYYGVQIVNNTSQTMTSFTLQYTAEQWTTGAILASADLLRGYSVSYSVDANSLFSGTYTQISSLSFNGLIGANVGVFATNDNLDGNASGNRQTLSATITGLSLAAGDDLWIRFNHTELLSLNQGVATDDFSFSATTVPEPGTYVLIGIGLISLFLCRKLRSTIDKNPLPKTPSKTAAAAALIILISMTGLSAQTSFNLKSDSDNRIWFQSKGINKEVPPKALRETFSGAWGKCTISRGLDSDGVPIVIVTMNAGSQAASFSFNDSIIKSPAGKAVILYPLNASTLPEIDIVGTTQPPAVTKITDVPKPAPAKPVRQHCKYKTQKDSMILQEDFNRVYGESVQREETLLIDSANCLKTVDNYLIAMNEEPPQQIWVRNESFIQRPSADASRTSTLHTETGLALLPITRPDQLMPVLTGRDLFENMSSEQIRGAFYNLLPEMERTSQQVSVLLMKWDQGTITQAEMQTLQTTAKIVWMVQCNLVDEPSQRTGGASNKAFAAFNASLAAEAPTPFLPAQ